MSPAPQKITLLGTKHGGAAAKHPRTTRLPFILGESDKREGQEVAQATGGSGHNDASHEPPLPRNSKRIGHIVIDARSNASDTF